MQRWARKEAHDIAIYPRESGRSKLEGGFSDSVLYFAITEYTKAFHLGDRIGTKDDMMYEVISVRTYPTQQQMTIKEIGRYGTQQVR